MSGFFSSLRSFLRAAAQPTRRPTPRRNRRHRLECERLERRIVPVATITVTKTVDLPTANPGDTLTYTVAITNNNTATDQTNVQLLDSVDPSTTFVGNSVKLSPMAVEHSFNAVGNTPLTASLTAGVHDLDGLTLDANLVYSGPATTTHGTLSVQADGTFTYTPTTGFQNGTDSFVYTVTDGDGLSSTNTVTINIGARVWYVNNSRAMNGDGSFNTPYNSLAAVSGATGSDTAGDIIYVYSTGTAYNGNMTLLNNEQLIGGGVALVVNGVTVVAAGTNTSLTTTAASTDAITLASGNTVKGFTIGDTTGFKITGSNFGTFTASNDTLQGTGSDLFLHSGTLAVTLDSMSSTAPSTGDHDVDFNSVTGSFTANAGTLSGNTGNNPGAVSILFSNLNVTWAAAITDNAGIPLDLEQNGGGTMTFSGAIASSNYGIDLAHNTGATINLTGGLSLTTGGRQAFIATGGGTVNVTQNNSTIVNTITTTSATALDVENTTIGASGLTFRSISAGTSSGSAGDGIVLDTTGASGGLTVTGNGSAGSGGTIQHKTGADLSTTAGIGIYLNSTKNVSLTDMNLHDFDNYAIRGNNVNGFTLNSSTINGKNGNNSNLGDPDNEGSVRFDNLTGSALIQSSTIGSDSTTGGAYNTVQILNGSNTTLNQLDVESSNLYNNNVSQGANGGNHVFLFGSTSGSNAVMALTVNNSQFGYIPGVSAATGSRGELIDVNTLGTSVMSATITGSTFQSWGNGNSGVAAVDVNGGGTGTNVSINTTIDNNTFVEDGTFSGGAAVNITLVGGAGTIYGKVTNNAIGNASLNSGTGQASADDIAIDVEGNNGSSGTAGALTGPSRFLIQGNTLQQYGEAGIKVDSASGGATVNATIFGNTVENPQGGPGGGFQTAFAGIWVFAGANPGDTNAVNVVIGDANVTANQNTLTGSDPSGANDVFLENDAAGANATLNLSKNGSTSGTAAQVIQDDNIIDAGAVGVSGTVMLVMTLPSTPPLLADPTGGVTPAVATPSTPDPTTPPPDAPPPSTGPDPAPTAGVVTTSLTQDELNTIVAAALQRWQATGLTPAQLAALENDTYVVSTTLPGAYLGAETPGQVALSATGGGSGWFIDATPLDDSEFPSAASPTRLYTAPQDAPAGHYDLLTTVMHEMGHVLGLDDSYSLASRNDLMFGYLTLGERRLPAAGEAAGAVPGSQAGTDFLDLPTTIGTLAAGTTIHAAFQVTINGNTAANTVSNQAEVKANGPIDVLSNTVTTTVNHPDLTLTKTDNVNHSVALGSGWTWTLHVANTGSLAATFMDGQKLVLDNLPGGLSVGATVGNLMNVTGGAFLSTTTADPDVTVTASGGSVTINPGGSFDVIITITSSGAGTFNNPAAGGMAKVDPNNVIVESDETNNTGSDSVTVTAPDLTLTKTDDVSHATTLGKSWTWTLHVANAGSADAVLPQGSNIVLDNLPGSNITYGQPTLGNFQGGITNTGNLVVSIDGSNDLHVNTALGNLVDMPPGSSFDVTFTATPTATGTFANPRPAGTAAVDPGNLVAESNEANNTASDSVTVTAPDLNATKSDDVNGTAATGSSWTWNIHVSNLGNADAVFASGQRILLDQAPVAATFSLGSLFIVNPSGISGTGTLLASFDSSDNVRVIASGGTVDLQAGGSFDVQFVCSSTVPGTFTNPRAAGTAAVDPDGLITESDETNNTFSDTVTVSDVDLTATKTNNVMGSTPFPGGWTWTIHVANTGTQDATFTGGQRIVLDNLPDSNITYGTVSVQNATNVTGLGNVTAAIDGSDNLTVTVNAGNTVDVMANGSFDLVFTATPTAAGDFDNPRSGGTAMVDPDNDVIETNENNNSFTDGVVSQQPDLTATKTDNVSHATTLGNGWTWTIHVANTGTEDATFTTGQRLVADNLPNANIGYGMVSFGNFTNVTGGANLAGGITAGDLSVTAGGGSVVLQAGGSFDVTFTATPTATGTFANPRAGGSASVDPGNVITESDETNNSFSDSVTVTAPDLTATKTDDVGHATTLGHSWTWTIHVANTGTADAAFTTGQTLVADNLPSANIGYGMVSYGNFTNVTGGANLAGSITSDDLAVSANAGTVVIHPGGGFDVTFTATPTAIGTFANPRAGGSASVDPGGLITESDESNNSFSDSVTVTAPDVTATKTDDVNHATTLGHGWTWTIHVANAGNADATFAGGQTLVADNLPNSNIAYGAVSFGNFSGVAGGTNLSGAITAGDLAVTAGGGSVVLHPGDSFDVTFTATPTATGTFANPRAAGSATVDPGNVITESDETNNSFSDSVTVTAPDLTATKTDDVNHATTLGHGWTWTIHVANAGNADATFAGGQTLVADNLPNSNIAYGAVSFGNFSGVAGGTNLSGAITAGDLAVTAGGGSVVLHPGDSFDVTFTATPTATGTFANPRAAGSATVDPGNVITESDETNNSFSDSVTVTAPDLTATKTDDVGHATTLGHSWTWTIHVANAGTADAAFSTGQTLVADNLPSANIGYGMVSFGNFTSVTGGANLGGGIVAGDLTVSAAIGSVVVQAGGSFDITFTATPTAPGTFANPRAGGSAAVDPGSVITERDEGNNSFSDSVTVTALDLQLTKDDGVTTAPPNSVLDYTLTYGNIGNHGATGVVITETVPTGTTFNAAQSDPGWQSQGAGVYKFTVGSLAGGGAGGTVHFVVTVNASLPPGAASITNTATIDDDHTNGTDANPDNNIATDTDSVLLNYGTAPAPYPTLLANNGARHVVVGATPLRLGNTVTTSADATPGLTGDADDDGVTVLSPFVAGGTAAVKVNVQNAPGAGARLDVWIDWNHNGSWNDPGDEVAVDTTVFNGNNTLTIPVPAAAAVASATATYARFRLSTAGGLAPTGLAADGEVEDYRLTLSPPPAIVFVDPGFTGTPGTDPDGAGPATAVGFDAFATVQQADNVVAAGGTLVVDAGTYSESVTLNHAAHVRLNGAVMIQSGGGVLDLGHADVSATGAGIDLTLDSSGAAGGAVTLGAFDNAAGALVRNLTVATGTTGPGLVTLTGVMSLAGGVSINSGGVGQTGGSLAAGSLLLAGTGTFTLNQANNHVGALAADVNGALAYTDAGVLTVGTVGTTAGLTTSGHAVTLSAGTALVMNQAVNVGSAFLSATVGTDATFTGAAVTAATAAVVAGGAGSHTLTMNYAADATWTVPGSNPGSVANASLNVPGGLGFGGFDHLVGGSGADTFNVTASATVPLTLDGGPPATGPGDTLNLDATGLPLYTSPGLYTVAGRRPVAASNFEAIHLNNAGSVSGFYGPDTADRDTALSGLSPRERFVQALYLDALGRPGTVAELHLWIDSFPITQAMIAGGIERSPEAREHLVRTWYQTYLGRTPMGGEEQGWVNALLHGQAEEAVLSGILGSPEYYARAQTLGNSGSADQQYVQALYQALLNRTGSTMEVAGWVNGLATLGRGGVALGILSSPEYRQDQIEAVYNALLHRPSDLTGFNDWLTAGLDATRLRIGIESSSEFFSYG